MTTENWLGGQHVLVSGGTQGVGAAIVRTAAARGAGAITITGRSTDLGAALVAELEAVGTPAQFLQVDLSDVDQARASVAGAIEGFGHLDCVVNAAGLTSRGTMLATPPELFDAHIAINLKAPSSSWPTRSGTSGSVAFPAASSTSSRSPRWAGSHTWRRTSPPKPAWPV